MSMSGILYVSVQLEVELDQTRHKCADNREMQKGIHEKRNAESMRFCCDRKLVAIPSSKPI